MVAGRQIVRGQETMLQLLLLILALPWASSGAAFQSVRGIRNAGSYFMVDRSAGGLMPTRGFDQCSCKAFVSHSPLFMRLREQESTYFMIKKRSATSGSAENVSGELARDAAPRKLLGSRRLHKLVDRALRWARRRDTRAGGAEGDGGGAASSGKSISGLDTPADVSQIENFGELNASVDMAKLREEPDLSEAVPRFREGGQDTIEDVDEEDGQAVGVRWSMTLSGHGQDLGFKKMVGTAQGEKEENADSSLNAAGSREGVGLHQSVDVDRFREATANERVVWFETVRCESILCKRSFCCRMRMENLLKGIKLLGQEVGPRWRTAAEFVRKSAPRDLAQRQSLLEDIVRRRWTNIHSMPASAETLSFCAGVLAFLFLHLTLVFFRQASATVKVQEDTRSLKDYMQLPASEYINELGAKFLRGPCISIWKCFFGSQAIFCLRVPR